MAADIAGVSVDHGLLPPDEVILGRSDAMNDVRDKLKRVACTDVPVLIRGEAGSGKEMLARLIHRKYPGETTPFHKVIPAGPDGWRKSASLVVPREKANGNGHSHHSPLGRPACIGTLFFQEIAELNFASQRKLAYLLHDDRFIGHGLSEYSPSLLRMICSTQHDIEREMNRGNFREDLFYSINIVSLHMPPLRSRQEDIPGFVEHYWERYQEEMNSNVPRFSAGLMEAFRVHDWPGNIRELAKLVMIYVQSGSENEVLAELSASGAQHPMLKPSIEKGPAPKALAKQEAREIERKIIYRTLREARWNRKQAARALNISYRTLLYKIKETGLPPERKEKI